MAIFRRYSEIYICSISTINFTRKDPNNTSSVLGAITVASTIEVAIAIAVAIAIVGAIAITNSMTSTQDIIYIPKHQVLGVLNNNHDIHLLSLCFVLNLLNIARYKLEPQTNLLFICRPGLASQTCLCKDRYVTSRQRDRLFPGSRHFLKQRFDQPGEWQIDDERQEELSDYTSTLEIF